MLMTIEKTIQDYKYDVEVLVELGEPPSNNNPGEQDHWEIVGVTRIHDNISVPKIFWEIFERYCEEDIREEVEKARKEAK